MINLSRAVRLKSLLSKDEVNQLGRHKVSKYLYHLTNAENYKKIQESDMLKTTKDGCFGKLDGNFMIELKNFLKNWRCNREWASHGNLGYLLLKQASKGKSDLVMLRIHASKLDHYSLKIRSQNVLFNKNRHSSATKQHCFEGEEVCFNKDFTKNGHALEYVYEDNIPLQSVEVVGTVNCNNVKSHLPPNATQGQWLKETLNQLFEGQPEKKMLDYFS